MNNESLIKIIRLSRKFESLSRSLPSQEEGEFEIFYPERKLQLSEDKVYDAAVNALKELGASDEQILKMLSGNIINKLIKRIENKDILY
jgi:uncharacterized protein YqeY